MNEEALAHWGLLCPKKKYITDSLNYGHGYSGNLVKGMVIYSLQAMWKFGEKCNETYM